MNSLRICYYARPISDSDWLFLWRGGRVAEGASPAKGVYVNRVSRVRIPLSPPYQTLLHISFDANTRLSNFFLLKQEWNVLRKLLLNSQSQ